MSTEAEDSKLDQWCPTCTQNLGNMPISLMWAVENTGFKGVPLNKPHYLPSSPLFVEKMSYLWSKKFRRHTGSSLKSHGSGKWLSFEMLTRGFFIGSQKLMIYRPYWWFCQACVAMRRCVMLDWRVELINKNEFFPTGRLLRLMARRNIKTFYEGMWSSWTLCNIGDGHHRLGSRPAVEWGLRMMRVLDSTAGSAEFKKGG